MSRTDNRVTVRDRLASDAGRWMVALFTAAVMVLITYGYLATR